MCFHWGLKATKISPANLNNYLNKFSIFWNEKRIARPWKNVQEAGSEYFETKKRGSKGKQKIFWKKRKIIFFVVYYKIEFVKNPEKNTTSQCNQNNSVFKFVLNSLTSTPCPKIFRSRFIYNQTFQDSLRWGRGFRDKMSKHTIPPRYLGHVAWKPTAW